MVRLKLKNKLTFYEKNIYPVPACNHRTLYSLFLTRKNCLQSLTKKLCDPKFKDRLNLF